jgi:hypothetical protein
MGRPLRRETTIVDSHRSRIGQPFYIPYRNESNAIDYTLNININGLNREDIYDIRKFDVEDRVNFLIDLYENNIIDYAELDFLYPLFIYIDLFNDRYGNFNEYTNIEDLIASVYSTESEGSQYIIKSKYYQIKELIKKRAKMPDLIAIISKKNKGTSSDTIRKKYKKKLEEKKQAEEEKKQAEQKHLEEEQKNREDREAEQKRLEEERQKRIEKKRQIRKEKESYMFGNIPSPQYRPPPQYRQPPARQLPTVPGDYVVPKPNIPGCPSHGKEPPKIETQAQYDQYKKENLHRKLSLIFHPDRNPGCVDDATEKFKKIQQYEEEFERQNPQRGGRKKSMKRKSKKQQKHNKTKKLKINKKNMKK